jgi:hypothetical protein
VPCLLGLSLRGLTSGFPELRGLLFGGKLPFNFEGDGISVHLVDTRGTTEKLEGEPNKAE